MELTFPAGGCSFSFGPYVSHGNYSVELVWEGDATALTAPAYVLTNCALVANQWKNETSDNMVSTGTSVRMIHVFIISITAPNAVVSITSGTGVIPANCTSNDLVVIQLPDDLTA